MKLRKLLTALKKKWIDGECRHICAFCEYSYTCNREGDIFTFGAMKNKYCRGYEAGYEDGYNDAMDRMEIFSGSVEGK